MITELSFWNFKSWKAVEAMRLAPITGLFGANSSGKTSILQLLLMLKQTIESTDRAQVLEFGDERSLTNLGSFRDVVHGHAQPGSLSFAVKWNLPRQLQVRSPQDNAQTIFSTQQLTFACELGENGADRLAVNQFEYGLPAHEFRLSRKGQGGGKYELTSQGDGFRFVRTQGRPWDVPAPVKFYGFPDQVYAYYQNAGFLSQLQLEFENLFNRVYYLGPLREFPQRYYAWKGSEPADMGRRGERVIDALLAARARGADISPGRGKRRLTLEQRVARWLQELGLIHSFAMEPVAQDSSIYQVVVQKTPSSAKVLITDVGFGVSQILPVLALCYYAPLGSIILLEQPEIHLHPSVQSGLADVLIDAVKNRQVQVVVESHSEHLLRRLQRRVAEQVVSPEDTALYFCQATADGSALMQLDVDLYGNILNWPKDFFGDEFGEMAAITAAAMERRKALQQ
jgi:predicted ATPase